MNEHDRPTSMAPARSGWVKSTPPSITPTTTPVTGGERPAVRAGVDVRMSHWQADNGSGPAATPK